MAFYAKIGFFVGRCRDCDATQTVLASEARSHSLPRCGGLLDLSRPALSRNARKQSQRRKKNSLRRGRTCK